MRIADRHIIFDVSKMKLKEYNSGEACASPFFGIGTGSIPIRQYLVSAQQLWRCCK